MILLNNDSVNFKTFPNNEHRLDLDVNHLSNENTVVWHYKTDASIFKLLLFNKSMIQLNQTYKLVIAYMPYSRMDRIQEENTAFSLELLVDVLSSQLSTVTKIYIFDPHSPVTLEKFKEKIKIPVVELPYSLSEEVFEQNKIDLENTWVIFPDKGAANRYNYDKYPNVIICEKTRHFASGIITGMSATIHKMTGKLGKETKLIIVDDMCSYGGTFVAALNAVKENPYVKFKDAWLIISHAENVISKGDVFKHFDRVFTTDSIYCNAEQDSTANNKVSVTPIIEILKKLEK